MLPFLLATLNMNTQQSCNTKVASTYNHFSEMLRFMSGRGYVTTYSEFAVVTKYLTASPVHDYRESAR